MAKRPVFRAVDHEPYCEICEVEFELLSGFSFSEKQQSILNLHKAYLSKNKTAKLLEVSSKSKIEIGKQLSAFNLQTKWQNKMISVECAFQGSKAFEKGGPYVDIYEKSSIEAKKDKRLRESGKLVQFIFDQQEYPLEPKDSFYNWIYLNALRHNHALAKKVVLFDCFTDIEFDPFKSINCQAKAVAVFVGLVKNNKIDESMKSFEDFKRIVYNSSFPHQ